MNNDAMNNDAMNNDAMNNDAMNNDKRPDLRFAFYVLRTYIFGIQPPGHTLILRAFDDGSAIGEEGDVVVVDGEAEQIIIIGADVADGGQPGGDLG